MSGGGRVYGKWPGLSPGQLYEGRDLALTTDFRDVFTGAALRHLGAKDVDTAFPEFHLNSENVLALIRT